MVQEKVRPSSVSMVIFMGKEAYLGSVLLFCSPAGTCYPNVSGPIFEWGKILISDCIKEPAWKANC